LHRQLVYCARMRARAASVRVTFPHQQPDSDNSHAKGSPHDSQVAGRWTIGPEGPQDMVHCIAPVYPRSPKNPLDPPRKHENTKFNTQRMRW